jgi:hypothetical protein
MQQPDVLIESHLYPSWDTYKQFKQLAGWKYFEAAENNANYFINVDSITALKDKYNDMYVQMRYCRKIPSALVI